MNADDLDADFVESLYLFTHPIELRHKATKTSG
jgi:hypothetical protein